LVAEQSLYNIAERTLELEVIPACLHYGLGLLPWSPLFGGLLGGVLKGVTGGRRASRSVQGRLTEIPEVRPKIEQYEALCDEIGLHPSVVALAWLLHQPAVTAPIVGPRTLEQLDQLVLSLEVKLADDVLKRLDDIFPGPGGAAPEAYAW
jgi:aryl-alcohol dehydrogenase-like predicted oxidoreductase